MKGPGFRLGLDVRRLWECPRCGRKRKAGGNVVSQFCDCAEGGAWMRLVEDRRRARPAPTRVDHTCSPEDFADPDDPPATGEESIAPPPESPPASDTI